jgi:plastocyanin
MPMKTNSTFRNWKYLALSLITAFFSFSVSAQMSHIVSVSNYKYDPKELTISAGDTVIWKNVGGTHNVDGKQTAYPTNPESFGNSLGSGWTYKFVFNASGTYNYKCDPHAGFGMVGTVTVNPAQPVGPFLLTVNFSGMTPHLGETLWLAVIDKATNMEIGRVKKTITQTFSVDVEGIESGKSYIVDFFADHNKNGVYDAPTADHAWRMEVNDVTGNTAINFAHNTNFTDIAWKNKLTVHFTGMTPHVGEKLTLYLNQPSKNAYLDTIVVNPVPSATFDISSYEIKPGSSYHIDFYADHNKNGVYDAPAADHAWRIALDNVDGDTIVNFAHNTNFTDIFATTSAKNLSDGTDRIRFYPNPARQNIYLDIPQNYAMVRSIKVFSITGNLVEEKAVQSSAKLLQYDVSQFNKGVYFMEINSESKKDVLKFIKQ